MKRKLQILQMLSVTNLYETRFYFKRLS